MNSLNVCQLPDAPKLSLASSHFIFHDVKYFILSFVCHLAALALFQPSRYPDVFATLPIKWGFYPNCFIHGDSTDTKVFHFSRIDLEFLITKPFWELNRNFEIRLYYKETDWCPLDRHAWGDGHTLDVYSPLRCKHIRIWIVYFGHSSVWHRSFTFILSSSGITPISVSESMNQSIIVGPYFVVSQQNVREESFMTPSPNSET